MTKPPIPTKCVECGAVAFRMAGDKPVCSFACRDAVKAAAS